MSINFPNSLDTTETLLGGLTDRATARLASALNSSALSFSVDNGSRFPTGRQIVVIENEHVLCSGRGGNTFSVIQRGYSGTVAASHVEGARVALNYTAQHHNTLVEAILALEAQALAGGLVYQLPCDQAVIVGQPVYVTSSGRIDLASSAMAASSKCAGLVTAATAAGAIAPFAPGGAVALADWSPIIGSASLTPGADYYVGGTMGTLTTTPPTTGFLTRVGRAISATTLDARISQPIAL